MKLGDWLKKYRADNNMTMQDLADACGFSKAYIGALEKGINPSTGRDYSPTIQTFTKIANGTGYELDSLLKMLDSDQLITLNASTQRLSEEETQLIYDYRQLDDEGKSLIGGMIRRLSGVALQKSSTRLAVQKNGNNYGVVGGNFSSKVTIR